MASLSCRRLRATLVDLAEGAIDDDVRDRAERHLGGCSGCREAVEALRAAPARLGAAAPVPDAAFRSRQRAAILERIREAAAQPRRPVRIVPRRPRPPFPWSAVFAGGLAVAIAAIGGSRFESTFRPGLQGTTPAGAVPNDVAALDDGTLVALSEVAATVTTARPLSGLEPLGAAERAALDAWLASQPHGGRAR